MTRSHNNSSRLQKLRPLLIVATVAFAALLAPIRIPGRLIGVLFDSAHLPTFVVVTWVAINVCDKRRSNWRVPIIVAALTAFLGCSAELLQEAVGRTAQLGDALSNIAGCGIGFAGATRKRWKPVRLWTAGVVSIVICVWLYAGPVSVLLDMRRQARQFPVLASFEDDLELTRWEFVDATVRRSRTRATDGGFSLEVTLRPGKYPHAEMVAPSSDWREFGQLAFDVWNPRQDQLELTIRVQDFDHNDDPADRFKRRLKLPPGHSQVVIELEDIRLAPKDRAMDMSLVSRMQLYAVNLKQPRKLYLDRFVLR